MANQKRFETVKLTLSQSDCVIQLIDTRIQALISDGIHEHNAAEYVMLQETFKAFTKQ